MTTMNSLPRKVDSSATSRLEEKSFEEAAVTAPMMWPNQQYSTEKKNRASLPIKAVNINGENNLFKSLAGKMSNRRLTTQMNVEKWL